MHACAWIFQGREVRLMKPLNSRVLKTNRLIAACTAVLAGLLALPALSVITIDAVIINSVENQYGGKAVKRVVDWDELMLENKEISNGDKLKRANRFFNKIRYRTDWDHWGKEDYWATPLEMLGTNHGDCEDYTIAKYFTLLALGIPDEDLRITYVNAIELGQAHMVLTYYGESKTDPLVLDNIEYWIQPASKRSDLEPVYSFNGAGLWMSQERSRSDFYKNGAQQIEQWAAMLNRLPVNNMDPEFMLAASSGE